MGHHFDDEGRFQSDKHPLPPDRIQLSFRAPLSMHALATLARDYEATDPGLAEDVRKRLIQIHGDAAMEAIKTLGWRDIRVTIAPNWDEAGRKGTAVAQVVGADDTTWTVVRWDDHDEDERLGLHKSMGLIAGEWAA